MCFRNDTGELLSDFSPMAEPDATWYNLVKTPRGGLRLSENTEAWQLTVSVRQFAALLPAIPACLVTYRDKKLSCGFQTCSKTFCTAGWGSVQMMVFAIFGIPILEWNSSGYTIKPLHFILNERKKQGFLLEVNSAFALLQCSDTLECSDVRVNDTTGPDLISEPAGEMMPSFCDNEDIRDCGDAVLHDDDDFYEDCPPEKLTRQASLLSFSQLFSSWPLK